MIADRYTCETVPGARTFNIRSREGIYRVDFMLPEYEGHTFTMEVWEDIDGSIYGEW